ncbi:MAG: hypothetical protein ACI9ON_002157 [Limisphaerales bacterium]|jgi:hypothetical protein
MVNPSHAWIHVVDWGMTVDVVEEAKRIMARERVLIDAARAPGFNMAKMKEAWKVMAEIH